MNIALFGNMASGKSSIANYLIDNLGYARIAFADPLKSISELAYGKIDKTGEYEVTSNTGVITVISGRQVLQRVGEVVKNHDRDFWLKCFFNTAQRYENHPLVVDDGRFLFERDALVDNDWLIVGVDTPVEVRMERYLETYGRMPNPEELVHQSEIEIPLIIESADVIISGEGPVGELVDKILIRGMSRVDQKAYEREGQNMSSVPLENSRTYTT